MCALPIFEKESERESESQRVRESERERDLVEQVKAGLAQWVVRLVAKGAAVDSRHLGRLNNGRELPHQRAMHLHQLLLGTCGPGQSMCNA